MKIKPKTLMVNLPIALTFDSWDEIPKFAATINSIVAGRSLLKCEKIGSVEGKHIGIFYLQRNDEFQNLRNSFLNLIDKIEVDLPSQEELEEDESTLMSI